MVLIILKIRPRLKYKYVKNMKKKAIISGVTGQDGPYLAKFLLSKGYKVYGIVQRHSNPNFENLEFLDVINEVDLIVGDVTDETCITRIIQKIKPHEFYNLAAQSFVGKSWDLSKSTSEVNAIGVLNILNAIRNNYKHTKFYQASTSEIYGNSEYKIQNELTPFRPTSPYAVSKLYAYWMCVNYRDSFNMFCSNGILFNHESPIRGLEFVTRKITDGVSKIKLGLAHEIKLGNINSLRDWGFAGDYVEAMWLMLQNEKPSDYVISTGEQHSIKDLIKLAFNRVKIKNWKDFIKIDNQFKRPSDVNSLCGDYSKAKRELNWQPNTRFNELVNIMVDADIKRNKLKQKKLIKETKPSIYRFVKRKGQIKNIA